MIVSRGLLIFFPSWRSYCNPDVVGTESAISGRYVGEGGKMETFPDLSVRIHALAGWEGWHIGTVSVCRHCGSRRHTELSQKKLDLCARCAYGIKYKSNDMMSPIFFKIMRGRNVGSIDEGSLGMTYLLKLGNGYVGIYYTVLTTLVFVWKFL